MVAVSVIVPVYNTEAFLPECLDSICSQTLKDIEIICVNDGSNDNSLHILEQYAAKDKRIKIIDQENKGVSATRNAGIKEAKGEYVGFVDSDDWISENFLEDLYCVAFKENADIAACGFIVVKNRKKKEKLKYSKPACVNSLNDKFNLFDMPKYNYIWNKIYKRKILVDNDIWFEEGRIYEDQVWSSIVMEKSGKACAVPNACYFYRQIATSLVHTTIGDLKKEEDLKWAKEFQEDFIEKNHLDVDIKLGKTKILFLGIPIGKIEEGKKLKKYYIFGIKLFELKSHRK